MGWLCPRRDAETPPSAAPPRYLSDNAWRKYRQDLLEQLTRDALKDL
jgi:rRNA maturation protein Nop10